MNNDAILKDVEAALAACLQASRVAAQRIIDGSPQSQPPAQAALHFAEAAEKLATLRRTLRDEA